MTTTGAAAAATVAAPFARTAGAAGSLRAGYWDHWVPGANTAITQICEEWAIRRRSISRSTISPPRARRHYGPLGLGAEPICEPAGACRGRYGRGAGAQRAREPGG